MNDLSGAIYSIKANPGPQGHRFGVIIQSDRFATSTITVALTSTRASSAIYRPEIELNGDKTRILTDQIFSLTHNRIGNFVGALEPDELAELDQALLLKFGLV